MSSNEQEVGYQTVPSQPSQSAVQPANKAQQIEFYTRDPAKSECVCVCVFVCEREGEILKLHFIISQGAKLTQKTQRLLPLKIQ